MRLTITNPSYEQEFYADINIMKDLHISRGKKQGKDSSFILHFEVTCVTFSIQFFNNHVRT